jgi:hypothetical protein
MTLREVEFKGDKGFRPCFQLKNQTGGDITINYNLTDPTQVSVTDNLGGAYNYSYDCGICLGYGGAKVIKDNEVWDWCSASEPVNVWQGPYGNPQVTSLHFVLNLEHLSGAAWEVPVTH